MGGADRPPFSVQAPMAAGTTATRKNVRFAVSMTLCVLEGYEAGHKGERGRGWGRREWRLSLVR